MRLFLVHDFNTNSINTNYFASNDPHHVWGTWGLSCHRRIGRRKGRGGRKGEIEMGHLGFWSLRSHRRRGRRKEEGRRREEAKEESEH